MKTRVTKLDSDEINNGIFSELKFNAPYTGGVLLF